MPALATPVIASTLGDISSSVLQKAPTIASILNNPVIEPLKFANYYCCTSSYSDCPRHSARLVQGIE